MAEVTLTGRIPQPPEAMHSFTKSDLPAIVFEMWPHMMKLDLVHIEERFMQLTDPGNLPNGLTRSQAKRAKNKRAAAHEATRVRKRDRRIAFKHQEESNRSSRVRSDVAGTNARILAARLRVARGRGMEDGDLRLSERPLKAFPNNLHKIRGREGPAINNKLK